MNLNQNTIHAKLYKEFYSAKELPDNLCPYFWKLFVAFLLAIPYLIFIYPAKRVSSIKKFWEWVGIIVGSVTILLCVGLVFYSNYHLIRYWINCYSYNSILATYAGVVDTYIFTVVAWKLMRKEEKPEKKKKQYIIIEFIKAVYGKYCPQIDWN